MKSNFLNKKAKTEFGSKNFMKVFVIKIVQTFHDPSYKTQFRPLSINSI